MADEWTDVGNIGGMIMTGEYRSIRRSDNFATTIPTWTALGIGITWLITLAKSTMAIRTFNIRRSQVRKRRKIGLNRPLSSTLTPVFYLPLFNSVAKRKLFLSRKNIVVICPPKLRLWLWERARTSNVRSQQLTARAKLGARICLSF
jgi:hypothetical protein